MTTQSDLHRSIDFVFISCTTRIISIEQTNIFQTTPRTFSSCSLMSHCCCSNVSLASVRCRCPCPFDRRHRLDSSLEHSSMHRSVVDEDWRVSEGNSTLVVHSSLLLSLLVFDSFEIVSQEHPDRHNHPRRETNAFDLSMFVLWFELNSIEDPLRRQEHKLRSTWDTNVRRRRRFDHDRRCHWWTCSSTPGGNRKRGLD